MSKLVNPSFEEPWEDDLIGATKNQVPYGWNLTYLQIGEKLRSAGAFAGLDHDPIYEVVKTIPETCHKGLFEDIWNLPENERPDGSTPLILDGVRVYKCFSNYNPFGFQLDQTLTYAPGTILRLLWPTNTHHQGDGSPGAAAWRIGINDTFCDWKTFKHGFEDRTWAEGRIDYIVPENGTVKIIGQFESRSLAGIDFFMDDVYIEIIDEPVIVTDGRPRLQYERTYLLLPGKDVLSSVDFTRLLGLLSTQIYDNQWTVGFSADDAGIGKLNVRNVIVVSLHDDDWDEEELFEFFEIYYPGVHVEFYTFEQASHFPVGTDEYPPKYWYVPPTQLFTNTHFGMDLNLDISPWGDVERGFPIYSVLDGTVYYATDDWSGVGMCVIEHELDGETFFAQYAHVDLAVVETEQVVAGQIIGTIANWVKGDGGDHLHFGVSTRPVTYQYNSWDYFIDPVEWLKRFIPAELVDASIKKESVVPPVISSTPGFKNLSKVLSAGLHFTAGPPGKVADGAPRTELPEFSKQYISEGKPSIVKGVPGGDMYRVGKFAAQYSPGTRTVWRRVVGDGNYITGNLRDQAQRYLNQYKVEAETASRNLGITEDEFWNHINYLGGINELISNWGGNTETQVEFECNFADLIDEQIKHNTKATMLAVAIGNPSHDPVDILRILPAAQMSAERGHVLDYHAYWTAGKEPNRSYLEDQWMWHAGRWEEWDKVFAANGVAPLYMFGESGMVYDPTNGKWVGSGGSWVQAGSILYYLDQIKQMNEHIVSWNALHGNRCLGGVLFTCEYSWGWDNFLLNSSNLGEILKWMKTV